MVNDFHDFIPCFRMNTAVTTGFVSALAQKFGGVGHDYKNQFRNILFNLKDTKNPDFRGAVCQGLINPVELASMTAMVENPRIN